MFYLYLVYFLISIFLRIKLAHIKRIFYLKRYN